MADQSSSNPLTKETIVEKCKKQNFKEIVNINIWGCDIDDVSIIHQLPNLEVVSMSVNKISTLKPFSFCPKITELYLRKNLIKDINQVEHLSQLKNLKVLWLSDNPCSSDPYYRQIIIKILP